nr:EMC3/TMCO1 family protein [Haloferax sp. ATB1]
MVLAAATGLYSTVMQDRLKDTDLLERHQTRIDDLKSRREAAKERGDDDALERLEAEQMEAMGDQWSVMKAQFKLMVWIMLVTIPAFLWMCWKVRGGHIAAGSANVVLPLVGRVGWQDAVFGPIPVRVVWYFPVRSPPGSSVRRISASTPPGPPARTRSPRTLPERRELPLQTSPRGLFGNH